MSAIVTVTVGRNVGESPMSLDTWDEFVRVVADAIRMPRYPQSRVEVHRGGGEWAGITEESAMVTLIVDGHVWPHELDGLKKNLAGIARDFGQTAVALTVGQSELIYSAVED